jgi:hypothetical protein
MPKNKSKLQQASITINSTKPNRSQTATFQEINQPRAQFTLRNTKRSKEGMLNTTCILVTGFLWQL